MNSEPLRLHFILLVLVSGMSLVERNRKPLGATLVNSSKTHKQYDPEDLVSLAAHIQKVTHTSP